MNERIKEVRNDLGMTQQEFADRLGVGKFTVVKWESGDRAIRDAVVKSICVTFGVCEEWLRNGTRPMYEEKNVYDEIGDFVRSLSDHPPDAYKLRVMRALARLPEEHWQTLAEVAARLYEECHVEKAEQPEE